MRKGRPHLHSLEWGSEHKKKTWSSDVRKKGAVFNAGGKGQNGRGCKIILRPDPELFNLSMCLRLYKIKWAEA